MNATWINCEFFSERRRNLLALAVIALAALAAYWNSFSGPYVFDDKHAIVDNAVIRSLWPIWPVLTPQPGGGTVCGRPVLNLSFALNYAAGGLSVWGYHAANLAIHVLAAFTLYGFIRRTLLQPSLSARFGADSWSLSLAIAVLWVLHPLQTESVTYIVQRAESLVGLFYLLTLYCFVRGTERQAWQGWLWLSVFTCAVGMGCKEVMASAPIIVLLYDRTFVAGTFLKALRQRWAIYACMASTWLLLAYFILAAGHRGGTAELATGTTTLAYLQTQVCAITEYFRLSIWPHPLIFDYGTPIITDPKEFAIPALLLLLLGAATVVGVWRRTLFGFLALWFFALLAPSSSVVAVLTQTMAEHRMYLPLAAVITAIVLAMYARIGTRALAICLVVAVGFGWLTIERNEDYRTEFSIWNDTVLKCPGNGRAAANLGALYLRAQQFEAARICLEEALRLNPYQAGAHSDLGITLCASNKMREGVEQFRLALQLNPNHVDAHLNLGVALTALSLPKEARYHLEEALRLDPGNELARKSLEKLRPETEKPKP